MPITAASIRDQLFPGMKEFAAELLLDEMLSGLPYSRQRAFLDVAEIVGTCRKWFEGIGIDHTAADVMAMTAMVLEREKACGGIFGVGSGDSEDPERDD